jgi:hypothetical protein
VLNFDWEARDGCIYRSKGQTFVETFGVEITDLDLEPLPDS